MAFDVSITSLDDTIADDEEMLKRVEEYKEDLVEFKEAKRAAYPRDLGSENETFLGDRACMACHEDAWQAYVNSPHRSAFATIRNKGQHFEPECISCHTTGYRYQNGYADESPYNRLSACSARPATATAPSTRATAAGRPRPRTRAWIVTTRRTARISTMRSTGKRSNTSARRRWASGVAVVLLVAGSPALALDLFTLWRQPEIPLRSGGAWVDYRTQVMAGGRREPGCTHLACLDGSGGATTNPGSSSSCPWTKRADGTLVPVPRAMGTRLRHFAAASARAGALLDARARDRQWRDGDARRRSPRPSCATTPWWPPRWRPSSCPTRVEEKIRPPPA